MTDVHQQNAEQFFKQAVDQQRLATADGAQTQAFATMYGTDPSKKLIPEQVLEQCMVNEDCGREPVQIGELCPDATQGQEAPFMFSVATVAAMSALPAERKLEMVKKAKGGSWYDGWVPYCGTCATMRRMEQRDYGFECTCCKNMIGWDLTRLKESPLNKMTKEQLEGLRNQRNDRSDLGTALVALRMGGIKGKKLW